MTSFSRNRVQRGFIVKVHLIHREGTGFVRLALYVPLERLRRSRPLLGGMQSYKVPFNLPHVCLGIMPLLLKRKLVFLVHLVLNVSRKALLLLTTALLVRIDPRYNRMEFHVNLVPRDTGQRIMAFARKVSV